MIQVDSGERKYCMIVIDCEQAGGHRTVINLDHEQGLELTHQLAAYYDDEQIERDVVQRKAVELLLGLAEQGAQRDIVQQLVGLASGQPAGKDPG